MAFVYQNTYISGDINSIGEVGKNYLTLMQYFYLVMRQLTRNMSELGQGDKI
jgi:hypothetical protein